MSENSKKNKGILWIGLILILATFLLWPGPKKTSTNEHSSDQQAEELVAGEKNDRKFRSLYFVKNEELPERELVPGDKFNILEGCFWVDIRRRGELKDSLRWCAGEKEPQWQGGTHMKIRALKNGTLEVNWPL